ncbi:MAG: hypothetical protein ABSG49_03600 [Methanoregula sp.]|uniref:hypothetical protein n=1 Tax=Methanoregula sp. TaxID=2052170 RepID=UPI003C1791C3
MGELGYRDLCKTGTQGELLELLLIVFGTAIDPGDTGLFYSSNIVFNRAVCQTIDPALLV